MLYWGMFVRSFKRLLRPVADHWQGAHHWLVTLAISVVGMTYIYSAALVRLPELPATGAIACWVGVGGGLLVWQITGVMRAINANLAPPVDVASVYGGYITIVVALVLVGVKMMDGVTSHLPKPEPIALLSSATFDVSVDRASRSISIKGEINYGVSAALGGALKRYPDAQRVVLRSTGGQIFAARTIARQIERRGLDTHVNGDCFSACTIVFMGGAKRTLGLKGQLGFHRYAGTNPFAVQTVDPVDEQQKDLDFFRKRGVAPTFLKEIFQAGHREIWRPDHKALLTASVITAVPQ